MASRDEITKFLNSYLKTDSIKDSAYNGMQVEGRETVKNIVFGVSACLELFRRAAADRCDMIIVHHGLIWSSPVVYAGSVKKRLEILFEAGITLLAYHLPLDMHKKAGNNIQIIKYLGAGKIKPFGIYNGRAIGFCGAFSRPRSLDWINGVLRNKLQANPVSHAFGPRKIRTLGVVSGGAARVLTQAVEKKLDLYITGETGEFAQEMCREEKINFISAGHYNSEKAGILALMKTVGNKFKAKCRFIDIPNQA